ncbi:alpha/beta hydrolase family protein [Prochlorococcus sp. MIT 1223]|uniref:alpha/beta hydrolase family protein n=1 Tax=Prochlorococcus sp. MIT 1223 TaxID=3096217 RepID=UPI002A759572|nr:prolyl oligopeptidase family serine peptidase [Prochlorococcus sp. MIT 1223]
MNFIVDGSESSQKDLQPLTPSQAVGETSSFKEPRIIEDFVFWLEQRPQEEGRTTALVKPWKQKHCEPQELTPFSINLRSQIHGYGGGVFAVTKKENIFLISWIDSRDGCLWFQIWSINNSCKKNSNNYLTPVQRSKCLSKVGDHILSGGIIDIRMNRWIGVMEKDNKDYLVEFCLKAERQNPSILYKPKDFIGYLTLNPKCNLIAWVEWDKSFMPWDASCLVLAVIESCGSISRIRVCAGQTNTQEKKVSVFQPLWFSNDEIIVAEDQTGWWNLMIARVDSELYSAPLWRRLWPMKADCAMPQWVFGMSTFAVANEQIIVARCFEGNWDLSKFSLKGSVDVIRQPFNDLAGLAADKDRVVAIAANSYSTQGLLEVDLLNDSFCHSYSGQLEIKRQQISSPEPFWFQGYLGELTHSWYYPPLNTVNELSPLLVKIHSGPTAMAKSSLNLEIQFWTTRGWSVLDVNYSGSTGFGRNYRERLNQNWGEADVIDCICATKSIIKLGKIDKNMIAIEGGSAGGFTALSCLAYTDLFKVASCRYPVTNLISMSQSTHRFEENYLDTLVGSLKDNSNKYENRSPINNLSKIFSPVIFFQGLKDKVVLSSDTDKIVKELSQNNIPVEYYSFANEAHGFRGTEVKIDILDLTEKFFKKHLGG